MSVPAIIDQAGSSLPQLVDHAAAALSNARTAAEVLEASNDSNDVTLGIGHFKWMPGKNDPAAFGHTQSDSISFSSAAMTIALRPAVSDTPSLIFDPFRHLLPLLVR